VYLIGGTDFSVSRLRMEATTFLVRMPGGDYYRGWREQHMRTQRSARGMNLNSI
jgi:hypothetical protein